MGERLFQDDSSRFLVRGARGVCEKVPRECGECSRRPGPQAAAHPQLQGGGGGGLLS